MACRVEPSEANGILEVHHGQSGAKPCSYRASEDPKYCSCRCICRQGRSVSMCVRTLNPTATAAVGGITDGRNCNSTSGLGTMSIAVRCRSPRHCACFAGFWKGPGLERRGLFRDSSLATLKVALVASARTLSSKGKCLSNWPRGRRSPLLRVLSIPSVAGAWNFSATTVSGESLELRRRHIEVGRRGLAEQGRRNVRLAAYAASGYGRCRPQ